MQITTEVMNRIRSYVLEDDLSVGQAAALELSRLRSEGKLDALIEESGVGLLSVFASEFFELQGMKRIEPQEEP